MNKQTEPPAATPIPPVVHNVPRPDQQVLTEKQWKADPGLQEQLWELIHHPVYLAAQATISRMFQPSIGAAMLASDGGISVDVERSMALKFAHRAGLFGGFNAMKNLSVLSSGPAPSLGDPWGGLEEETEKQPKQR